MRRGGVLVGLSGCGGWFCGLRELRRTPNLVCGVEIQVPLAYSLYMAKDYVKLMRVDGELNNQIKAAADQAGLTESEWMRRALRYALTVKAPNYTITTTTEVNF